MTRRFLPLFICIIFLGSFYPLARVYAAQEPGIPAAGKTPAASSPSTELQQTLKGAPAQDKPAVNPYADLPEEYIAEAQSFYTKCAGSFNMFRYYDCKCLATKFLDKRIELGPTAPQDLVVMNVSKECPDATLAAGAEYETCLNNKDLLFVTLPIEDYCACYASTFAKLYELISGGPSSDTFVNLRAESYSRCKNPNYEYYRGKK